MMMDQHQNVVMDNITEDQHDNTAAPHGTVKPKRDVEQAEMSGLTAVDESEDLRTSAVECQPISEESQPTAATAINR